MPTPPPPRFAVATGTLLAFVVAATAARADPTAEQFKAMYEDSQRQLQQSQDRKNQLATENEQLKARVAELQSRLRAIEFQAQQAQFIRNQFAVWTTFMQRYPLLLKRFETYISGDARLAPGVPATLATAPRFFDPDWPFSAASGIEAETSTTAPGPSAAASPLVGFFHRSPEHWCQLCAAAAARRAEAERDASDGVTVPSDDDLLQDLSPR